MKKHTKKMLLYMLYTGPAKTLSDAYNLIDFYTTQEIECVDDLYKDHKEFYQLITDNIEAFEQNERNSVKWLMANRIGTLGNFSKLKEFFPEKQKGQIDFAKQVEEIVGHKKDVKILEVGGGNIPFSSIILGQNGYNIYSMDEIFLSNECMKNLKVKSYRQLFNLDTKVDKFDVVVGRRPCHAIYEIVNSCTDDKVPYFMKLCGCELASGKISSWKPILRAVDKGIELEGDYAYNFENSTFGCPTNLKDILKMDEERGII